MNLFKFAALLLALALIVPAATAQGKHYKFNLDLEGVVGGKNLRSGNYRVEIKCDEQGKGTVTFFDGPRRAAQVTCNMVETQDEADFYGVTYGTNEEGKKVVATIYLKGQKEKVILAGK